MIRFINSFYFIRAMLVASKCLPPAFLLKLSACFSYSAYRSCLNTKLEFQKLAWMKYIIMKKE